LKKILKNFLNPFQWFRAWRFHRHTATYDKSQFDLELAFYAKILKNDMLHWGWFENPDIDVSSISIATLEKAQIHYADEIISRIQDINHAILDIGCGMGGLANLMSKKGLTVEALTPNLNQVAHIKQKYKNLKKIHACRFEDLEPEEHYGTLVNAESLQYIGLKKAFQKANSILLPQGWWIITDYFRSNNNGENTSGYLLADFKKQLVDETWEIIEELDITNRVLPTLRFVNMYAKRFLMPLFRLGSEKLRYKKAWLYYLTKDFRQSINAKIEKEMASVDPELFVKEKRYMLFVLKKKTSA